MHIFIRLLITNKSYENTRGEYTTRNNIIYDYTSPRWYVIFVRYCDDYISGPESEQYGGARFLLFPQKEDCDIFLGPVRFIPRLVY